MIQLGIALALCLPLFAVDNSWTKVRELKTGTELRVTKAGERQPVLAKLDEATDENLIVILKNEQVAIPKEKIDRIDYRPPQTSSRVKTETKSTATDPDQRRGMPNESRVPGQSTSSGVTFGGSKADFETIYRRTTGTPPKQ